MGDTVEQFDNLCEVQSDKASVTITSRYDGKITKIFHDIDELALVGKPLLEFEVTATEDDEADEQEDDASSSDSSDSDAAETDAAGAAVQEGGRIITPATPAVRRLAKEHKVDLAKVPPTGKNGRVLKGDVLEFLGHVPPGTNVPHPTNAQAKQAPAQRAALATPAPPADRVEVLKGVRKAMLKSMSESLVSLAWIAC